MLVNTLLARGSGRTATAVATSLLTACLVAVRGSRTTADEQPGQAPPPVLMAHVRIDPSTLAKTITVGALDFLGISPPVSSAAPDWTLAFYPGAPLVTSESDLTEVRCLSVRVPDGYAVVLVNQSRSRANLAIRIALPAGVYSGVRRSAALADWTGAYAVQRLESVVTAKGREIEKPGWLDPNSVAVYVFVDRSRQAATALRAAKQRLASVGSDGGSGLSRMRSSIRECEAQVARLDRVDVGNRERALEIVHRALLTSGYALSICRNAGPGGATPEASARLTEALETLDTALAEWSAALLNLVPNILVATAGTTNPLEVRVSVVAQNCGTLPVRSLFLSVDPPAGTSVTPAEASPFGTLGPGQTARAEFSLTLREQADLAKVAGQVTYMAAKGPAHLRAPALH